MTQVIVVTGASSVLVLSKLAPRPMQDTLYTPVCAKQRAAMPPGAAVIIKRIRVSVGFPQGKSRPH
jgi:hypothetical protein